MRVRKGITRLPFISLSFLVQYHFWTISMEWENTFFFPFLRKTFNQNQPTTIIGINFGSDENERNQHFQTQIFHVQTEHSTQPTTNLLLNLKLSLHNFFHSFLPQCAMNSTYFLSNQWEKEIELAMLFSFFTHEKIK